MNISEIKLSAVRKIYGRNPVLKSISSTLRQGQISLILGPNGAGKSTLLSILSTLSRPTSGSVHYGALTHDYVEKHLRGKIALVAHAPMLYRRMTGRENLLFFARMHRLPRPEQQVARWLDRVEMAPHGDKPLMYLSRGMIQRLALARALMPDPDLLLMDEPFTGLDRQATALLRDQLKQALGAGKIVALVTHELEAIDGLCEHLLILNKGRVAVDTTAGLLSTASIRERYHAAV